MKGPGKKRYVDPDRWRSTLLLAALLGVVVAGLDVPLRWAVQQIGWTAPAGSRISAGSVIPIAIVSHLLFPHRGVSILALLLALATYLPSVFFVHGVLIRDFGLRQLAVDLMFVGIVALGVGTIFILSLHKIFASRVQIGFDPRTHCTKCGYPLHGLSEPRCPECGRPFEMAPIDAPATCGPDA
jgi:hypothetical protein